MLTKKLRNTKVFEMIRKSQSKKQEMDNLKENSAEVRRYFQLENERRQIHSDLSAHVEQYGVKVEEYKPAGLVERKSRWVKVSDVEKLAESKPEIKDLLLPLINSKNTHYTREV